MSDPGNNRRKFSAGGASAGHRPPMPDSSNRRELIIRNGSVVVGGRVVVGDVMVADGSIVAVGDAGGATARREIDATGLMVFPGLIDAHVHFNEPGRAEWEGIETGSTALVAGGGTCFFDMPLNSHPPVLTAEDLQKKREVAERKSLVDFALWGGLCPGSVDEVDRMAEAGAIGFKAFLCPSGIAEFPTTDPATLRAGMLRAKKWNRPVAVHAEDPRVLSEAEARSDGRSMADFLASRPKAAEVAAVRMACEVAGETGAVLHVVHVSCAEALAEIVQAKMAGVDVTAEVCGHHLLFQGDDARRLGAVAKCAPPLREAEDVALLWRQVLAGVVDTMGSDHSPAPPSMKTGDDMFAAWGGISGCQHAFPGLLGEIFRRSPTQLPQAAEWLAGRPAERFRLENKGRIKVGFDADLALVELGEFPAISRESLLYRHRMSLYEGYRPGARIVHVVRRGEHVVESGRVLPVLSRGRFLRPD